MKFECVSFDAAGAEHVRTFVAAVPEDLAVRSAFRLWRQRNPDGYVRAVVGGELRTWAPEDVPKRKRGRQPGVSAAVGRGKRDVPIRPRHFRLTEAEWQELVEIGGGNATKGLRRLLRETALRVK